MSAIPGSMIPLVSQPGDLIVDPFCGSGASIVEAIRLGRRAIGIDTNPVALLIATTKLIFPSQQSLLELQQVITEHTQKSMVMKMANEGRPGYHPNMIELQQWYHLSTYNQLLELQGIIESLPDEKIKIVARCIFSSILKNVCSQGKHWGWICDNVKPKPEEIQPKDAIAAYLGALHEFSVGVKLFSDDMSRRKVEPSVVSPRLDWDLRRGDACKNLSLLEKSSVDAIVTSPPYYGVTDYVKAQRLTFLWYPPGLPGSKDFEEGFEQFRNEEIGSRSHRHRKNSFHEYIAYMKNFLAEANRVLKPGGKLCLVIGESGTREATTPLIMSAALDTNLKLIFSSMRDIRATRRRIQASVPNESILIYDKYN